MSKYTDLLTMSDKDKAASVVASQETQAKASVASFKASYQGSIAKSEAALANLLTKFPLDLAGVIAINKQIAEDKADLETVTSIEADLFG